MHPSCSSEVNVSLPRSSWALVSCGLWLVVLGLYFVLARPVLLPEDVHFLGQPLARIRAAIPELEHWLRLVFIVLGGFAAGAGVLTTYLAAVVLPHRPRGASWVIAIAGLSTAVLMSAVNFQLQSDSWWLLLIPAVLWVAGLVAYLAEGSGQGCSTRSSPE